MSLKDTNTVVPIFYTLMGVKHTFTWGNIDKKNGTTFTINIDTDGTGYFFDFTGVEVNESVKSSQRYECKPPKTVTVGKDNFLEWVETLKETFIKLK